MKLRRLELVGFKSFMNKTALSFEDGITAIVGPNGCGKSNIVDAIFWVMGDQSPKHLRGSDMGDVIFAGSDKYPPAGMAEVNLTLSTEDGGVPADYRQFSEITVSRRLYRSGESEYLINKVPCRLKDVVELFMDTGVGAKSYSIIEQGHIEKIVGLKAEDRRVFIEEAAGVMKFKSRRREAELKIEGTEQNLLRIGDILSELKRQIDSLERQAKKAQRYKTLKSQIRDIELAVVSQEFALILNNLNETKTILSRQKEVSDAALVEIHKAESFVEALKLNLTEMEKSLQGLEQSVYQTQHQIQQCENQKKIKLKEIENWKSHELKDSTDSGVLKDKWEQIEKSRKNILGGLAQGEQEAALLKENLQRNEIELESETQKQQILHQKIERHKSELVSLLTQGAHDKQTLAHLENQKEVLHQKRESVTDEEADLSEQAKKIETQKKEIQSLILKSETDRKQLLKEKEEKETTLTLTKREMSDRISECHQVKEQHQRGITRLDSLREIQKNLEGYNEGVKALLLEKGGASCKVLGILADMIETDMMYEKAIESALEGKLQILLVETREEALKAVGRLMQTKTGISHFVALTHVTPPAAAQLQDSSCEPLWNKVRTPYEAVIYHFLKDTYLVSDFQSALRKWDEHPGLYSFITREGMCINRLGIITGGHSGEQRAHGSLLARKREMRELQKQNQDVEEKLRNAESLVEERSRMIENINTQLESLTEALHRQEVSETSLKKDVSKCEEDLERILEEREDLRREQEDLSQERKEILEAFGREQNRKQQLDEKRKVTETAVSVAQSTYEKVCRDIENKKKGVTELKVAQASLIEKRDALKRQQEHFDQNLKMIHEETEEKKEAIALAQERQHAIVEEIKQDDLSLDQWMRESEAARVTLAEKRIVFDQEHERCRVLEERLKKQRTDFHKLESQLHEYQLKISQGEMAIKHLSEQMRERYLIELEEVADRYTDRKVTEEEKKELSSLKDKAANMGEVNLTALEEFAELQSRSQTLEKQQEDLLKSLDSLKKTIEKINRICRTRFEETFHTVNANFKRVFPMLFEGGKAELILTDGNDLLETGIEIVAKPPGKKHQNINLLSGGEKALTAVSLMFAVFLMKPSPFCLLDEVDAPLDDANVGRFNDMVRQMTTKSQFIVITHHKKTMAMTDVLYGVTMESPGISTMVSVKLDRAIEISQKFLPQPSA